MHAEKDTLLSKLVELRVSVKQARRDKLVKHTN